MSWSEEDSRILPRWMRRSSVGWLVVGVDGIGVGVGGGVWRARKAVTVVIRVQAAAMVAMGADLMMRECQRVRGGRWWARGVAIEAAAVGDLMAAWVARVAVRIVAGVVMPWWV